MLAAPGLAAAYLPPGITSAAPCPRPRPLPRRRGGSGPREPLPGARLGSSCKEGYLSYIDVSVFASYPVGLRQPPSYPHSPVVGVQARPAGGQQKPQHQGEPAEKVPAASASPAAAALPAHLLLLRTQPPQNFSFLLPRLFSSSPPGDTGGASSEVTPRRKLGRAWNSALNRPRVKW